MSIVKDILNKTINLRNKYEKRSDARKYLSEYEGLIALPSETACYKISFGYFERFLLKANHQGVDKDSEKGMLKIERWDEGCGYFSGEYSLLNENKKVTSGSFEWSGSGKIEDTWDNFSKFE